ncbi:DUF1566 domain-containing protein, partial [Legionella quateirensis]
AGPQGLQGLKGDTGPAGPQGIRGEAGLQGAQGLKGDAGPAGPQGMQGDAGPQGLQGLKGDTGPAGPQGIRGEAGIQGVQGLKGDTGAAGPQGMQGIKGDVGATGSQGVQGSTGADGRGVPTGGISGQILAKSDGLDFNTMWIDPANSGIRRQIGDTVLGGTVIYVNSTGIHGLIAANTDQSFAITWWDAPNIVTNPAAFDNDGKSQSDWRLPTLYELSLIYAMRNELGKFNSDNYWCSTEKTSSNSWVQSFKTGTQTNISKGKTAGVRAIRSF